MPYTVNGQCELCGACVSGCQCGAITEGETHCHIDTEICVECGTCASNCPYQAIHFVDDSTG